jgi:hypothetical protein
MFSNSKRHFNVTILYNKSNHFGLENDAELLKKSLAGYANVKIADPLEHPVAQDSSPALSKVSGRLCSCSQQQRC